MNVIKSILCTVSLCATAISVCAAESTNNEPDTIRYGIAHSTLIIAGKFGGTAMGGGGATSSVEVSEVFKAPKDSQVPKRITVFWLTAKFHDAQLHTNTFLLFLRPDTTNADTAYFDATDKAHPFIQASEANVRFLKSKLVE